MASLPYFGTYSRLSTADKSTGAKLVGADNIVGDELRLTLDVEGATHRAVLSNRFGAALGTLDPDEAARLALAQARGWKTRIVLVAVYYTSSPEPEQYWAEVAVMSYAHDLAQVFDVFVDEVRAKISEGVRIDVNLGREGVAALMEAGGHWLPSARVDRLRLPPGTALIKDHASFREHMIERARERNVGCMVAGWAFIAALVALFVLLVRSFLGL